MRLHLDEVFGSAARGAGPSLAGPWGGAEESGSQAAGCCPGADESCCQRHNPGTTAGWTQESQWVPQKQGELKVYSEILPLVFGQVLWCKRNTVLRFSFFSPKVSADTSKKRINSLTMDLMEARNTLDTKNKVLYICKYFILLNLVKLSVFWK